MGMVKPSPAGTATTSAITRGSIAKSWATPSVTGISIATTAELLISSVSTIDSAEMIAMATGPLCDHRETVFCDSQPPAPELHRDSFADVVGSKPVALLFSTPQLCQSRVCGPVTDIALQMEAKYRNQMTFIHQEVYVDNDVQKGLRPPLQQFHLQTEPWLFVVNKQGTITARLEGSIGVREFENAVKTGL